MSTTPRPRVSVLVGYDAFRQMCELADGSLVSSTTAASLLDEAVVERIVMDGASRVLDIGRARSFVGAARRAVEIVDRHCTGTGCDRPLRDRSHLAVCGRGADPSRQRPVPLRAPQPEA